MRSAARKVKLRMAHNKKHKIGRYEVVRVVGKGAMGVVYEAWDSKIGRKIAVKTISLDPNLTQEEREEYKKRFLREAQAAGTLSHPNIVTIYDVCEAKGEPFIAQEYAEGGTMKDLLKQKKKLSPEETTSIFSQICSAVSYAHKKGIVHRDLKPANIMVSKDGKAKILDFGIARITTTTATITQTGTVMGTPAYMSPEQVRGERVDHRSDIFSLGVVLYELLTGKRPFEGKAPTTVIFKIVNEAPTSIRTHVPALPKDTDGLFERVLAKKSADRFQTADELAQAVTEVLAGKKLEVIKKKRVARLALTVGVPAGVLLILASFYFYREIERRALKVEGMPTVHEAVVAKEVEEVVSKELAAPPLEKLAAAPKEKPPAKAPPAPPEEVAPKEVPAKEVPPKEVAEVPKEEAVPKELPLPPTPKEVEAEVAPAPPPEKIAAVPKKPFPPPDVKVVFQATPPAMVYVDGIERDYTPLTLDFKPGKHIVKMEIPGYKSYTETIQLQPGQPKKIIHSFPPFGFLTLSIKYEGVENWADVYLDEEKIDNRGFAKRMVEADAYILKIERPGFKTITKGIKVRPRKEAKIEVELEKEKPLREEKTVVPLPAF